MEECEYCGETFEDEEPFLEHLASEHAGELGSIDRRRVKQAMDDDGGPSKTLLFGVVGGMVLLLLGAGYFAFTGGGDGGTAAPFQDPVQAPGEAGTVHAHGPITVTIDGQQLDFSQGKYQLEADAFHFESGEGSPYHLHARGVTLEYALETLDIGVTNSSLAFQGTLYNASEDTVIYEVNDERVNPETYVIQKGDEIRVVANSSA